MKWISIALIVLGLTACSGGDSSGTDGKSGTAAAACDAFVKNKLETKQYTLDLKALAASMKQGAEGRAELAAPIVIEPGLTTEVKQNIECSVRFGVDENPEVLTVNFIW